MLGTQRKIPELYTTKQSHKRLKNGRRAEMRYMFLLSNLEEVVSFGCVKKRMDSISLQKRTSWLHRTVKNQTFKMIMFWATVGGGGEVGRSEGSKNKAKVEKEKSKTPLSSGIKETDKVANEIPKSSGRFGAALTFWSHPNTEFSG